MSAGRITLFGCGRLGICTAIVFEEAGYDLLGVEVVQAYADAINARAFKSYEPGVEEGLKKAKNLRITMDPAEGVDWSDLLFICVDTPSTGDENCYDTFKLERVLAQINERKPKNKHIMVMCTVLPGWHAIAKGKFLPDCENCTLNYNPEFIAQGAILQGFRYPDVVLIGAETAESGAAIKAVYERCVKNPNVYYAVMSPASAEIEKISLNCFVTTKIAYANMIADIADRTPGADKFAILQAVGHDPRVGLRQLLPGFSFSGPCFPRDNRALASYARKIGADARISEATDACNKEHIKFQAGQFLAKGKAVYVFEHIGYKFPCEVPITEESAKILVAIEIAKAGRRVILRDQPQFIADAKRLYGSPTGIEYQDISVPYDGEVDA